MNNPEEVDVDPQMLQMQMKLEQFDANPDFGPCCGIQRV
jgi:hypothetical protein